MKSILIVNLFLLLFFSNGHVIGLLTRSWEYESVPESELTLKYNYGIVPGGFSNYFKKNDRLQFNGAGDRLMQAMHLYCAGKIGKIIISGGSGKILRPGEKEAVFVKNFLLEIGIPKEDILIEDRSRNSYENAKYTAEIFGNDSLSYLLITSAFHMKRSYGCFAKTGMKIDPYPVNFMYGPERERGRFLEAMVPSAGNFSMWNILIKEWIGYLVYKIRGWC